MTIPISLLVAIIGCGVSCLTFFLGYKKNNTEEAARRARFEGVIEEKINYLQQTVDELKKNIVQKTENIDVRIEKEISEHERRYHGHERKRAD